MASRQLLIALAASVLIMMAAVISSAHAQAHMGCHSTTPVYGPLNTLPINTLNSNTLKLIGSVPNGKAYVVTVPNQGGNTTQSFYLVHVYGDPYSQGFAQGQLLASQITTFMNGAWQYLLEQLETALLPYLPQWLADMIAEVGLDVALDYVYDITVAYTDADFYDELHGVCDGTPSLTLALTREHLLIVPRYDRLGRQLLAGATLAHAAGPDQGRVQHVWSLGRRSAGRRRSPAGARPRLGHGRTSRRIASVPRIEMLTRHAQGPFRDYSSITVYHPTPGNATQGNSWINVGMTGFIGALTGLSSAQLGISEIGVSYVCLPVCLPQ